jgi:xanthine/CO dehydrogenase XdhC/CoxF family maturation factor
VFALAPTLPPRILLLGAGPDALPVFGFAEPLGWKVTLYDHREAYTDAARFPGAERVVNARPEALAAQLPLDEFDAAVVMSHHLASDLAYLRALAASRIGYVGLLGPAPRRERLQSELGATAALLAGRLRSPVGLALGGRSSASIALAIVAEIHAWLYGRTGGPFGVEFGVPITNS